MGLGGEFNHPVAGLQLRLEKTLFFLNSELPDDKKLTKLLKSLSQLCQSKSLLQRPGSNVGSVSSQKPELNG